MGLSRPAHLHGAMVLSAFHIPATVLVVADCACSRPYSALSVSIATSSPRGRAKGGQMLPRGCHCEPSRRLAWQSVSLSVGESVGGFYYLYPTHHPFKECFPDGKQGAPMNQRCNYRQLFISRIWIPSPVFAVRRRYLKGWLGGVVK